MKPLLVAIDVRWHTIDILSVPAQSCTWRLSINGIPYGPTYGAYLDALDAKAKVEAWTEAQVRQWYAEHPTFSTEPTADNSYAEHFRDVLHRDERRMEMARW